MWTGAPAALRPRTADCKCWIKKLRYLQLAGAEKQTLTVKIMNRFFIKSSAAVCAALSLTTLSADPTEEVYQLEDFIVSAGPLARPLNDYASPFTALDNEAIQRSGANTLGQLLDGQPGVAATSYGAAASRPIIRGMDGPRVRILEAGLGSLDVSETSPDHAIAIEPLLVERVEILRGPSALLYGGAAIGGVVNVISKEIPREPLGPKGYEGALETRYDSVSEGKTYLGYGAVGGDHWALRATGLSRKADNYEIPGEAELHHDDGEAEEDHDDHGEEAHGATLENSYVENDSFSVGGTWFFGEQNYLGASFSNYEAFYGVPGHAHHEEAEGEAESEEHHEEGVAIDLERQRFDLELALVEPSNWIEAARLRFGYTDYAHAEGAHAEGEHAEEAEGDAHGEEAHGPTRFLREGWELRAEATHNEWGIFDEGIFGLEISNVDFEATGEEVETETGGFAFGPPSTTQSQAAFISEHIHQNDWSLELGGRLEAQQIETTGAADYDDIAFSLAAGLIYSLNAEDSLALSLQRSQRHPNSTELHAQGPHLATRQYENGDASLGLETAYSLDLSYRHRSKEWNKTFSVFYTHCVDHIYSSATGATDAASGLAIYNYGAADSVFYGFEAELERPLIQTDRLQVSAGFLMDLVKAENTDSNDNLPRIPPLRIGGELRVESGPWEGGVLVRRVFKQDTLAPEETETAAYTDLQLDLAYNFALAGGSVLSLFAEADNLLDEDIRHHTSYLKDLAPLPGRNLTLGARLQF